MLGSVCSKPYSSLSLSLLLNMRQPERLFARKGLRVASEAVAATRSRGITSFQDLDTGIDLLLRSIFFYPKILMLATLSRVPVVLSRAPLFTYYLGFLAILLSIYSQGFIWPCGSSKDHNEFEIVRESVQRHLEVLVFDLKI